MSKSPSAPTSEPSTKTTEKDEKSIDLDPNNQENAFEFAAPQYYDFSKKSSGLAPDDEYFGTLYFLLISRSTASAIDLERKETSSALFSDDVRPLLEENCTPVKVQVENDANKNFPITSPTSFPEKLMRTKSPSPQKPSKSENHSPPPPSTPTNPRQTSTPSRHSSPPASLSSNNQKTHYNHLGSPKMGTVRDADRIKINRLRSAAPMLPAKSTKPLTVPVEFKFSTTSRSRRLASQSQTDETLLMSKISINSQRSKPPSLNHNNNNTNSASRPKPKITVPVSPKFSRISQRSKRINEDINCIAAEENLIFKMRKETSAARNSNGNTIPKEFNFSLYPTKRSVNLSNSPPTTQQFVARPIPKSIYHHPRPSPKKSKKITVPQSPAIRKTIPNKNSTQDEEKQQITPFKAKPVPIFPAPTTPRKSKRITMASTPKFPGKQISLRKQRKFQENLEAERKALQKIRAFKATKPQYTAQSKLASIAPKPLTKPSPFKISETHLLSKHQIEKLQKQHEDDQKKEMERLRQFKSRSIPPTINAPFIPEKSCKPLTCFEKVTLHSSERAIKRSIYNQEQLLKKRKAEAEKAKIERIKMLEEAKKLQTFRQSLIPTANPMPRFQTPPAPQKCSKPLTVPESPAFSKPSIKRGKSDT